jgi:cystathionine gamma-lyase
VSPDGDATRVVRAGLPDAEPGTPFLPGPVFAGPYHLPGDPADSDYVYGRYGNPTWSAYEAAVGELEGGEAVLFASGMAAAAAVLLNALRPGDRAVVPADCYMHVRNLASGYLGERGVEVALVATAELDPGSLPDELRLLWLETPSNPGLEVCDIAALAKAGHERGALVAVDNTTATPLGQRPLDLGADMTVGSDTKALTGHSDLLLGHVSTADDELYGRLQGWRNHSGSTPGPFEAWLGHRSMSTLDLRLARQGANAAAVAELLAGAPAVTGVRWPWRPEDPSFALASRQMLRPNGVVSAELADEDAVARLLAGSRLWTAATSFGGVHSTVDRRAQWGGDAVAPGFVRLSCGIEDTADLVKDLSAALATLG